MSDDSFFFITHRNDLNFVNHTIFVIGRKICIPVYPIKIIFKLQYNIFTALYPCLEFFINIWAIKQIHNTYPVSYTHLFWHTNGFVVKNCLFTEGARAALWYSQHLHMTDTVVEAPKMFREMDGVKLENVQLPNALETFWYCRNVELKNVQIDKADYLDVYKRQTENYILQVK